MATAGFVKPEEVRYRSSSGTSRETQPKSAASNWEDHAFTFINTVGELAECDGAVPGNITKIYAIDVLRANATDIVERNVEAITSDSEILISITNSANEALAVTSQALVSNKFALRRITSGGKQYWTIDLNNIIDQHVEVVKIAPQFAIGTLHGPVYVKVLKSLLQFQP